MMPEPISITLLNRCEPFVPTHWYRLVRSEGRNLVVDLAIEVPGGELVGVRKCIDYNNTIPTVLDPNSFTPQIRPQSLQVLFRSTNHFAALYKPIYSAEAAQDLKSANNLDAIEVFRELFSDGVDETLNGR